MTIDLLYEVVHPDFDGGTSETDDRIWWVQSSLGLAHLKKLAAGAKCDILPYTEWAPSDVDAVLPGDEQKITDFLNRRM